MLKLLKNLFVGNQVETPAEAQRERIAMPAGSASVIYAIGDVHGCIKELRAAEKRILADAETWPGEKLVVYLGDYVDRGPASDDVIRHLMHQHQQPGEGIRRVMLCGNHDDAFLRFVRDPARNMEWLNFGGDATLRSYDIDSEHILKSGGGKKALYEMVRDTVPSSHMAWIAGLPGALSVGEFVFVHAGIQPGLPLEQQTDADLMWIRDPFLSQGPGLPVTVVHGHTAGKEPVFGPQRICIDTGAYATGTLTVLRIANGIPQILP